MDSLPVYLVHWNAPEWCRAAVVSLVASEGVGVDVTVVDNGSADQLLTWVLPAGTRILPMDGNRGYAGGANAALEDWRRRRPDSELVVIGSHDLIVEPSTLRCLVDVVAEHPRAGVVGPLLVAPYRWAGGGWNGRTAWQFDPDRTTGVVERAWTSGTCLLLRRACVDEVGDFDEALGSYVEDVDYGLRVNDAGWTVLVTHDATASSLGSVSTAVIERITTNSVLLAAKRSGLRGALLATGDTALAALRGWVAGLFWWRDRERRAVSVDYARQRSRALARLPADVRLRRILRSGRAGSQ